MLLLCERELDTLLPGLPFDVDVFDNCNIIPDEGSFRGELVSCLRCLFC